MQTLAARLVEHGRPLQVEAVELDEPGPSEVAVEMLYSSVNPVDRYAALGRTAADAPVPRTLGMEGVGSIDGRIVLLHGHGIAADRDGLWSRSAVVPSAAAIEVPDGVDPMQASAMGIAGVTAWRTVTELAKVTSRDRVLVLGASGGVGSMAVSAARSIGAAVWGQTGSSSNADWIGDQGADRVLVGDAKEVGQALGEFAPTVVVDPLGGDFTGAAIEAMAAHGRLVIFGTSAGPDGRVPLQSLYRKGICVLGYAGLLESDETMAAAIAAALQALAEHRIRVTIGEVLPLAEVGDAMGRLGDRSVRGKVVLDLTA